MAISGLSSQSTIYSTISSLMAIQNQPITALQTKVTSLNSLTTVYSNLENNLSALGTAASAMNDVVVQPMSARAVSSSDSSIVTATATPSADLGSHSISVAQLARQHTLVSNQFSSAGTEVVTAQGVGDKSFTVLVNGQSKDIQVTLVEGETNSEITSAVATAINAAFAGVDSAYAVTATALADSSTTSKLVLTSKQTGLNFKMTLSDDADGGTLLSSLGLANESVAAGATTGGYVYADSQLDSKMTVDGVAVTRDSNVVSDVLNGITLNLNGHQADGADPVNLTVSADTAAIRSTIQTLITNFNKVIANLNDKTSVNAQTGARSDLAGATIYRNLLATLRTTLGASVADTGWSKIQTLADVGITQAKDGTLSIKDDQALSTALASHPAAVSALFTATDGIANQLTAVLKPFTQSGGFLDKDKETNTNHISTLNDTIARMQASAAVKQRQLTAEYAQVQALMSTLNQQQTYMQQVISLMSNNGF